MGGGGRSPNRKGSQKGGKEFHQIKHHFMSSQKKTSELISGLGGGIEKTAVSNIENQWPQRRGKGRLKQKKSFNFSKSNYPWASLGRKPSKKQGGRKKRGD